MSFSSQNSIYNEQISEADKKNIYKKKFSFKRFVYFFCDF